VDDADDFDSDIYYSMEDHVVADDKVTKTRPDIVARGSELRVRGEHPPTLINSVRQRIGGRGIIRSDVLPDFDQILPGAACANNAGCASHASALMAGCLLDVVHGLPVVGGAAANPLIP
jgi:hypothetical protein